MNKNAGEAIITKILLEEVNNRLPLGFSDVRASWASGPLPGDKPDDKELCYVGNWGSAPPARSKE